MCGVGNLTPIHRACLCPIDEFLVTLRLLPHVFPAYVDADLVNSQTNLSAAGCSRLEVVLWVSMGMSRSRQQTRQINSSENLLPNGNSRGCYHALSDLMWRKSGALPSRLYTASLANKEGQEKCSSLSASGDWMDRVVLGRQENTENSCDRSQQVHQRWVLGRRLDSHCQ